MYNKDDCRILIQQIHLSDNIDCKKRNVIL